MPIKTPSDSDRCIAIAATGIRCKCWKYDYDDKYCYQHFHLDIMDKVTDFKQEKKEM